MDPFQAFFIAVVQGATELFPVSSLGHAVVLPALLGWNLDQASSAFLPFLVLLHAGTATALLIYFWRDWLNLATGLVGLGSPQAVHAARRIALLIVVATIPAVILGATLEHFIRALFASPLIAAGFLVVNGLLLFGGERLRKTGHRPMSELTVKDALAVGVWQCTALLPGISRSGATIVGGLLRGVSHEAAAHFSFLIATPIIIGATVKEIPKMLHETIAPGAIALAVQAAIVSGIVAFLSTAFLMRYFRRHEDWALTPFAWYCVGAGILALGYLGLART